MVACFEDYLEENCLAPGVPALYSTGGEACGNSQSWTDPVPTVLAIVGNGHRPIEVQGGYYITDQTRAITMAPMAIM
jgi:hypothetical protein